MSASNKKKLRKEENLAAMTEKQKKEQQEAKKLKAYTLTFAVVMVLVVAIVVGVIVSPIIDGMIRRNSDAVTIGDHTLTTAELTYFYVDSISEYQQQVYSQYYSTFGSYWSVMLGFDTTKSLNTQIYDKESGKTWATYFMDSAIEEARSTYALYDDAIAKGHTLSEDEQKSVDSYLSSLDLYATYYDFSSVKAYLRNSYGNGATEENYTEYYRVCSLASSYLSKYAKELEYDDEAYRAYEKDKFEDYSTVSFVYHTLQYTSYLGEGTKDEDGKTTWTDEQKAAAREAMKKDMEALVAAEILDKDTFDKAIQALEINKIDPDDKDAKLPTATEAEDIFYSSLNMQENIVEWMKSTDRKSGDLKAFEVYTYAKNDDAEHKHGDDCGCDRTIDGYTIVLFSSRNDNTQKMANVRHILVKFENGTKDSDGNTTYSDEEKAKAKKAAEELLQQWKDGKADEDSFAELANKESDDKNGSVTDGGLYEDIYPGKTAEGFEKWCLSEERKAGDTGIVETEYGYHVMYYVSTDELSYRDMLIDSDLRTEDTEKWHDALVEKTTYTIISLDKMDYDYVVSK